MSYYDKIDNFISADKAKEAIQKIQKTQSNLLDLYLVDVIQKEQYNQIEEQLEEQTNQIMESLKQFYNEQKKVS